MEKLATLTDDIDAEFSFKSGGEQEPSSANKDKEEYMFLKMLYQKAKLLRKTR